MLNRLAHVRLRTMRTISYALLAIASASCGASTDGVVDPGSITISLPTASGTLVAGATATFGVSVGRTGSFAGAIDVTVEGLPTGVTASVVPTQVAAGVTSATVNLTGAATAVAGASTLTVRAKGTGVSDKTATFSLTVQAAPAGGGFTMSLSPATLSVAAGANSTSTLTIARSGSFTGAVNLAVSGAPAGVTATLSSASVTGTTATLTIAVAAGTAATTANITITGSATGAANQTATLGVTTTVVSAGSFALSLAPTSLSVAAGANGTSTVTIARTAPFTGTVNLAVTGAPAGVTATLSSAAVAGNTATLTVAVAAGTAAGNSNIVVTGSAAGVSNAIATLALSTTVAVPGSGNVVFRFCEGVVPAWFAVQDGAGAWTRVIANGSTFSFDVNSATGGVAFASTTGNSAATTVYYGTKAELTAKGVQSCPTATAKTVTGTTAGLSGTDQGFVSFGGRATVVIPAVSTSFTLNGVADGSRDLIATRSTVAFNGTSVSSTLAKIILRRGLNPAASSALAVLDFGAAESFAPGTAALTVNNLGTDLSLLTGLYTTAGGASGVLYTDIATGGAARTFFGVPVANQAAGDLQLIQATALPPNYATDPIAAATTRSAGIFFAGLGAQAVTLGPALSIPTVTTASTSPYVRLRSVLARQTEYDQYFYVSYQQAGATPRTVQIEATVAYVGAGSFDATIPDFSGAGYDANWALKTGTSVLWVVNATGWTAGVNGVVTATAGTTTRTAMKAGNITP